jgi:hypothetical protein
MAKTRKKTVAMDNQTTQVGKVIPMRPEWRVRELIKMTELMEIPKTPTILVMEILPDLGMGVAELTEGILNQARLAMLETGLAKKVVPKTVAVRPSWTRQIREMVFIAEMGRGREMRSVMDSILGLTPVQALTLVTGRWIVSRASYRPNGVWTPYLERAFPKG